MNLMWKTRSSIVKIINNMDEKLCTKDTIVHKVDQALNIDNSYAFRLS